MTLSIAIRVGQWGFGVQTSRPFVGIERVRDGAWTLSVHIGLFPKERPRSRDDTWWRG